MNIIEWSKTAKQVDVSATECSHEAKDYGFDFIMEHADHSWIGVVDQPTDYGVEHNVPTNYWVHAGNYDNFFEHLSDAQVALWNHHAKPSHEEVL